MVKDKKGVQLDTELDVDDLKELVARFKALIRARIGRDFPTDPWEQLWGAVVAVFESWNNDRAQVYRELNDIPQSWGTAVNVQAMVFGNLGDSSATGVAFSRDAGTGEDLQRRVPCQCPGRRRGGRHSHAAAGVARGLAPMGRTGAGE